MENKEQHISRENEKLELVRDLVLEELDSLSEKFHSQMAELGHGTTWAPKADKIRVGEKLDRDEGILKIVMDIAFPRCSPAELDYIMKEFFKPRRAAKNNREED